MDTLKRLHEKISALVDGELPDSELELAMAALNSPAGRAAWRAYHLIGDTLRAQSSGAGLDDAYAQRLAARLAAEAALPGEAAIGSAQPANAQAAGEKPGTVKPGAAKPATAEPGTAASGGVEPGSAESGGGLPDAAATLPS
ncbi:sigma-E factor negative regulatory protein [Rugamonas sp.]|uniref:sigma-E factor negative regulatory protein n=1 Tax=Rugamonas sp. TaxID=1926287 RepID=UPI0025EFCA34|nr:sigma-E factor negative regulatory protein [Rugamonas sp.]